MIVLEKIMDFNSLFVIVFRVLQGMLILLPRMVMSQFKPSALTIEPPPMAFDVISPECYNFTVGNYNQMEFYSPNYPHEYPNKVDCVMYIQAPRGFYIELYFMDTFSVELSEGCKFDFIEFRDGPFGYSKFISRFCGDEFPVSIRTETRFLWAQFSSDDLVQFDGFRAVYEYKIDEHYKPEMEKRAVCRSYLDNLPLDGELNSKVFPLADTSEKDYPINVPVDCTWEMLAERGHKILLSDIKLHMSRGQMCVKNRIEIYDGSTNDDDRTGVYCDGAVHNYRSHSNRIFIRIYGSRLADKPVLLARYTVFKPANNSAKSPCSSREFFCDGMCLSQALVCNGHVNCPDTRADEKDCDSLAASSGDEKPFPLMVIILSGIGGVVITGVAIVILVMCQRNGKKNKRRPSIQKQDSQKRNALELAVSDSTNTAYHLAKQNSQATYYSLPRPAGHATMMQHRGSFSSKVPSEGDFGDHIPDPGSFKKYLQLDQNITDDDSSRCPSPYSPGFTTIIEQHPLPPGVTPDLGWNYPSPMEQPTSPTLAENLSRLQQYTQIHVFPSRDQTVPLPDPLNTGMTMEFKYDPTTPVYPATKFRIKSPETQYGWKTEETRSDIGTVGSGKSLTFKNQDAEVAPDLTREIETT